MYSIRSILFSGALMQVKTVSGVVIMLFVLAGVLLAVWHFTRSRITLEQWAAANGYQLLQSDRRYLRRGPYFWTSSKGQEVFFIVVRDAHGNIFRGWARVGGFLLGQLSERVSVRWAE